MYVCFVEHCGYEGEDWATFIMKEGNEEALNSLSEAVSKMDDSGDQSYSIDLDVEFSKEEADACVKFGEMLGNGYCDHKIANGVLKISKKELGLLNKVNEDGVCEDDPFYKGGIMNFIKK
jgi:hypothetical protein